MKKTGLLLLLMILLVSCSNDSDDKAKTTADYFGKWSNIHEIKDVKNAYAWTDYYIFKEDMTFTRSRTISGVTTTGKGTFEIIIRENGPNFVLTYDEATSLVLSCTTGSGGTKELLYLWNGKLENATGMCDATATYQKEK